METVTNCESSMNSWAYPALKLFYCAVRKLEQEKKTGTCNITDLKSVERCFNLWRLTE